ncbi:MAG: aminotransferase class I/II-fold pyridoxal phosphate-dependent enzyme [Solirubrobacterales bacterium]
MPEAEEPSQEQTPYVDALLGYAAREPDRLNVPGHKGGPGADPALSTLAGETALRHDIPALIEGIDVGAGSPFQQAQRLAAEAWGARRSWFLVNGASQGNHAACIALAHLAAGAGEAPNVVVQRNVHTSTIDGIVLTGLRPGFVAPELDDELGLAHCMTPEALEAALESAPEAIGAYAVSPTYFGAAADVAGLAEVAHARGVPLVVDESWGGHLHFSDRLPGDALTQGADLVVSSTHKMVGSLTQSAILHLGSGELLDEVVVDRCVTAIETTSPSSLLGGSLDAARHLAATRGAELLDETIAALERARGRLREIEGLDVLDERLVGRPGVHGWDPLRLAIDVRGTGTTGYRLARLVREVDEIYFELASENVIVAALSIGAPAEPMLARLVETLRTAVGRLDSEQGEDHGAFAPPPPWGPLRMTPREAFFGPQEAVPLEASAGRVAAESLAAYPPGVPNVLPGELLTEPTLEFIAETLAHGGSLRGASDRELRTIRVVAE